MLVFYIFVRTQQQQEDLWETLNEVKDLLVTSKRSENNPEEFKENSWKLFYKLARFAAQMTNLFMFYNPFYNDILYVLWTRLQNDESILNTANNLHEMNLQVFVSTQILFLGSMAHVRMFDIPEAEFSNEIRRLRQNRTWAFAGKGIAPPSFKQIFVVTLDLQDHENKYIFY